MRIIASLAAVAIFFSPLQLLSSNTISLSSTVTGRIGITIENSEPIGCVQFTLTSHGGKFLAIRTSTRLDANWSAVSNIKADTVAYVVIYNSMGDVFAAGNGECVIVECASDGVSKTMTTAIGDIKATGQFGGLVELTAASTSIPVETKSAEIITSHISSTGDGIIAGTGNYPNPFNPSTTISFSLRQASFVSLNIYDITGRLVKELNTGELSEGNHSFHWNCTDAAGLLVTSGVYFAKLQTPTGVVTHKMLLSK